MNLQNIESAPKSKRGGKRPGAGRPHGTGRYRESTKSIRIPFPLLPDIQTILDRFARAKEEKTLFISDIPKTDIQTIPLFSNKVHAGFPSSGDDHIEEMLNLHEYVVRHKESTFFVKVQGDSMTGASIHEGDIIVVDRSLPPKDGNIVVALVDTELAVKRLSLQKGKITLLSENPKYPPLLIREHQEMRIFGVVTYTIHKV